MSGSASNALPLALWLDADRMGKRLDVEPVQLLVNLLDGPDGAARDEVCGSDRQRDKGDADDQPELSKLTEDIVHFVIGETAVQDPIRMCRMRPFPFFLAQFVVEMPMRRNHQRCYDQEQTDREPQRQSPAQ